MKKIAIIFSLVLIIIPWTLYFKHKQDNIIRENILLEQYDKFKKMGAYKSALDTIDQVIAINFEDKYKKEKISLLINSGDYKEVEQEINHIKDIKVQESIIKTYSQHLFDKKEFNRFVDFINKHRDKNLGEFITLSDQLYILGTNKYENILQLGEKMFLSESNGKTGLFDFNERQILNKEYYDRVIGFEEKSGLITVIKDGKTKLIDLEGNIYSSINKILEKPYLEGYFQVDNQKYIDITGKEVRLNNPKIINDLEKSKRSLKETKSWELIDKNSESVSVEIIKEIISNNSKNVNFIKTNEGWILVKKIESQEKEIGILE